MASRRHGVHAEESAAARAEAAQAGAAPTRLPAPPRSVEGAMLLTSSSVHALQRLAGNAAVTGAVTSARREVPVVQREFEDLGQAGEGTLEPTGAGTQPSLAEGAGGAELQPQGANEFGEMDGLLTTGTEVHAFVDRGKVASGLWHHCGGTGGKGNENTGSSTVVAPVYESSPPTPKGGPAKAWVRKGTGTVKVSRSWNGVPSGNNGAATWGGSGGTLVYLRSSAVARMGKHESGHVKETKKIHDVDIKALEKRVKEKRTAATEADAVLALQTHVDWNNALTTFAAKDTAMNAPGLTFDTTDQAKADFYHDKGAKKIKGVDYGHLIEAP